MRNFRIVQTKDTLQVSREVKPIVCKIVHPFSNSVLRIAKSGVGGEVAQPVTICHQFKLGNPDFSILPNPFQIVLILLAPQHPSHLYLCSFFLSYLYIACSFFLKNAAIEPQKKEQAPCVFQKFCVPLQQISHRLWQKFTSPLFAKRYIPI